MASIELTLNGNSRQTKNALSESNENSAETQANDKTVGSQTTTTTTATENVEKIVKTNLNNGNANEALKIIGHLKNIEKINEKRRIFLSNTLTETQTTSETSSTTDEKTEKIISTTNRNEKFEAKIDEDDNSEKGTKLKDVLHSYNEERFSENFVDKANGERFSANYATQTLPLKKSPLTPPPKPPMLSRTRSLGVGDQRSSIINVPLTPANTPSTPTSPQKTPPNTPTATLNVASPVKATLQRSPESAPILRRIERPVSILSDSPRNISVNHYERLIEELKCPGCASPMKTPVMLCQTGHSICAQCTRVLLMCPLCKEPFTNLRSRTVEALCHKAHFRCCYASGGCNVRLQTDLLSWHEKQCVYKPMKCFMGRVWGDCEWSGREVFWKEHLEAEHSNRVFKSQDADLIWNMGVKQKPLTGYYVFDIFDELFNFYEIYDRDRVLFTMTCTSTIRERKHNFAYEVTVVNQDNEALAITQKFPVHSEYDKDILAEGTCVSIPLSDLAKFLNDDKLLHYRVYVLEIKSPRKLKTPRFIAASSNGGGAMHSVDFQQTQIEGVNLKGVPSDSIVTRKIEEIPFVDNTITPSSNGTEIEAGAVGLNDEDAELRQRFYSNEAIVHDSSSESDAELEAYIAKKWGTPQLHFNRKYLKDISTESAGEAGDKLDDRMSVTSKGTSYTKKMTNSLRKSFRLLKTPIAELKPHLSFVKRSPEKKSP